MHAIHFLLTCNSQDDATTATLRSLSDEWVKCDSLTPLEVNERIRSDHIDILIEIDGHTQNSQIPVMALCPAPIQVNTVAALLQLLQLCCSSCSADSYYGPVPRTDSGKHRNVCMYQRERECSRATEDTPPPPVAALLQLCCSCCRSVAAPAPRVLIHANCIGCGAQVAWSRSCNRAATELQLCLPESLAGRR
jgi:hypothetical protein